MGFRHCYPIRSRRHKRRDQTRTETLAPDRSGRSSLIRVCVYSLKASRGAYLVGGHQKCDDIFPDIVMPKSLRPLCAQYLGRSCAKKAAVRFASVACVRHKSRESICAKAPLITLRQMSLVLINCRRTRAAEQKVGALSSTGLFGDGAVTCFRVRSARE